MNTLFKKKLKTNFVQRLRVSKVLRSETEQNLGRTNDKFLIILR